MHSWKLIYSSKVTSSKAEFSNSIQKNIPLTIAIRYNFFNVIWTEWSVLLRIVIFLYIVTESISISTLEKYLFNHKIDECQVTINSIQFDSWLNWFAKLSAQHIDLEKYFHINTWTKIWCKTSNLTGVSE